MNFFSFFLKNCLTVSLFGATLVCSIINPLAFIAAQGVNGSQVRT